MKKPKLIVYLEEMLSLWDNAVENQSKLELLKQKLYGNMRIYKVLNNNTSMINRCNKLIDDINNKIVQKTFAPKILRKGNDSADCVQNIVTLCNYTSVNIACVQAYLLAEQAGIRGDWMGISRSARIKEIESIIYSIEHPNEDKSLGQVSRRVAKLKTMCNEIELLFRLTGDASSSEKESLQLIIVRLRELRYRGISSCIETLKSIVNADNVVEL